MASQVPVAAEVAAAAVANNVGAIAAILKANAGRKF
jgi:hypothetical protein